MWADLTMKRGRWEVYAVFFFWPRWVFPRKKQTQTFNGSIVRMTAHAEKAIWPMARKLEYRLEWRTTLNRSLSPQLRMNTILLSLGIDWGTFFRQIKARTRRGRRLIIVLDSSYAIPMRWFVFVYNPVLCILSGELLSAQLVGAN